MRGAIGRLPTKFFPESYALFIDRVWQCSAAGLSQAGAADPALIFGGAVPEFASDWGAGVLTAGLHIVVADVGRVSSILPELSSRDKCENICSKASKLC